MHLPHGRCSKACPADLVCLPLSLPVDWARNFLVPEPKLQTPVVLPIPISHCTIGVGQQRHVPNTAGQLLPKEIHKADWPDLFYLWLY